MSATAMKVKARGISEFFTLRRGRKTISVFLNAEYVEAPGAMGQWGIHRLEAWDTGTHEEVYLTVAESAQVLRNLP